MQKIFEMTDTLANGVLCFLELYLMNTNMTGFGWLLKIFASLCEKPKFQIPNLYLVTFHPVLGTGVVGGGGGGKARGVKQGESRLTSTMVSLFYLELSVKWLL